MVVNLYLCVTINEVREVSVDPEDSYSTIGGISCKTIGDVSIPSLIIEVRMEGLYWTILQIYLYRENPMICFVVNSYLS